MARRPGRSRARRARSRDWRRPAQVPALGVPADEQRQADARHRRQRSRPPGPGAERRRRQVGAAVVGAGEAERHRQDRDAAPVPEDVGADAEPVAKRSPDRSSNGRPRACTRAPGAWPQIRIGAVADSHGTGRGAWPVGVAAKRAAQSRQPRIASARSASGRRRLPHDHAETPASMPPPCLRHVMANSPGKAHRAAAATKELNKT